MKTRPSLAALAVLTMFSLTLFAGQAHSRTGRKVILLSSAVAQGDLLAKAANDDVAVIRYNTKIATMVDLVARVREELAGEAAASVAFVNHDYGENKFYLTKSETISLGSSQNSQEQQAFWKELGELIHPAGRIDLLACNLARGDRGNMLVATLENLSGRNVAASTNKTGNPSNSSDWILETDRINVGECYFNSSELQQFTGELISLEQKLTMSNASDGDFFGVSVSVYGSTAVVGSPSSDYYATKCGTASIFVRNTYGTWIQRGTLAAIDAAPYDHFGGSVSIFGNTAVVGAQGAGEAGAAYIFSPNADRWSLDQKLAPEDGSARDMFGSSVSISDSGHVNTAVIGAEFDDDDGSESGSAYVFVDSDGTWIQQAKLTALDAASAAYFGCSVSVSGNTALVGARGVGRSGAAYVFVRDDAGNWMQQQKLVADDGAVGDAFGNSVGLDGDVAVVGAPGNFTGGDFFGSAYVFVRNDAGNWTQRQKILPQESEEIDSFGRSVSISGNIVTVGAPNDSELDIHSGAVYVYSFDDENWGLQSRLVPEDPETNLQFGYSVGVSADSILAGAYGADRQAGAAYIYSPPGIESTTKVSEVTSSSALFGGVIRKGLIPVEERGVILGNSPRLDVNRVKIPDPNFVPDTDTDTGTGAFTFHCNNLQADTTYYYCAYVSSSRGTYFGNIWNFDTLAVHTVTAMAASAPGEDTNGEVRIGLTGQAASTVIESVDHGNPSAEIYAVPDTGYHFVKWLRIGSDDSARNPLIFESVIQDLTIVAVFAANTPDIRVLDGTKELRNDDTGTVDFGAAKIGSTETSSFIIRNSDNATAPLELMEDPPIIITGEHASDFTVVAQPRNSIAEGQDVAIEINFTPGGREARNAVVTIPSNDSANSPFIFTLRGKGVTPEIGVMLDGLELAPSSVVDFGAANHHAGKVINTFTINNTGSSTLSLDNTPPISVSGPAASNFWIENLTSKRIAPNSSASFEVTFNPSNNGPRVAMVTIYSNDLDEGEFSFVLQGQGISSRIDVLEAVKFGSQHLAGSSVPQRITIHNGGDDTLSLDPSSPITITGRYATYFKFGPLSTTTLGKGESTELTVYYMPEFTGDHSANLTINGSDEHQPSASIVLSGEAELPKPIAEVNVDEDNHVVVLSVSPDYDPGSFPADTITYNWEFKYGPFRPAPFLNDGTYQGESVRWDAPADGVYKFELTVNAGEDENTTGILVFVGDVLNLEVPASAIEGAGILECRLHVAADLTALGEMIITSDNPLIETPTTLATINEGETIIPFSITVLEDDNILQKQDVTINVKANDQTVATAVITVEDNDGPRIRVFGSGTEIPNAYTPVEDSTTFRKTVADSRFVDQTFTIRNEGYDVLRLNPIVITGENMDDFEVLQQPTVSGLGVEEEAVFVIRFRPLGTGANRQATVVIANNDQDAPDYHFDITGAAIELIDRKETGSGESGGSGACGVSSTEQTSTSLLLLLGGMIGLVWLQHRKTQTNSPHRQRSEGRSS